MGLGKYVGCLQFMAPVQASCTRYAFSYNITVAIPISNIYSNKQKKVSLGCQRLYKNLMMVLVTDLGAFSSSSSAFTTGLFLPKQEEYTQKLLED